MIQFMIVKGKKKRGKAMNVHHNEFQQTLMNQKYVMDKNEFKVNICDNLLSRKGSGLAVKLL